MARESKPKPKPVTVDEALRLIHLQNLRVAPDGKTAAFVKSEVRKDEKTRGRSIWAVSAEGGAMRQLTQGPEDEQPRWSPDGDTLAFTRKDDKDKPPRIYLLPMDGGEPRKLVGFDEAPEAVKFVPKRKRLSFLAPTPDDRKTRERKEKGDDARVFVTDDRPKRLWTATLASGKPRACSPEEIAVWEYDWLPDGKSVVVIFTEEPRLDALYFFPQLGILDTKTAEIRPLEAGLRFAWDLRASPDGRCIAVGGGVDDTPHGYLAWVVDVETGKATCMTPNLQASVATVAWLPDSSGLMLMVEEGVRSRLYMVLLDAPGQLQPVCHELPASVNEVQITQDGGAAFVVAEDSGQAPEVWRSDLASGKTRGLTSVNTSIRKLKLGRCSVTTWTPADDLQIDGLVTQPPGFRRGHPRPTILQVHGGPAGRFREDLSLLPRQVLASAGYVVLAPNPRGSAGYGSDFLKANVKDWGGGDFSDLMAGLDMLVEQGIADPERLGIYGASYGGYMTAWTVTQTDRFKAAVCQCGITDLYSFHGQTDITPRFLEMYFRASPYDDPELYRAHSAMTHIKQVKTPTLFLHGEQDVRVPIPQSYEMYWGLRHVGVDTEFVVYPREGHGILETPHQRDMYTRIVEWFDKYLK